MSLWHLKVRDIIGLVSLFTGVFMLGAYATHLMQLFDVGRFHVVFFVFVNAGILLSHTLQKIKCQSICVAFGHSDLADGIKAGHY